MVSAFVSVTGVVSRPIRQSSVKHNQRGLEKGQNEKRIDRSPRLRNKIK